MFSTGGDVRFPVSLMRRGRHDGPGRATRTSDSGRSSDPRSAFYEEVLEREELADLDPAARRLALRALAAAASASPTPVSVVADVADEIDGYGPLTEYMRDPEITDVLVNGAREVWVERGGRLERTATRFDDDRSLEAFVERMLAQQGRRADASHPIADARLSDGSRMHVVLPPVAPVGPIVSIRRFPDAALSLSDLVDREMMSERDAAILRDAVGRRVTIAISGGTGSGKTTLLNALLGQVSDERVVVLEETPELHPICPHYVRLVARDDNVEGLGGVDLAILVRAALRMRPDRIVVGEVRGPEALPALAALSVGHEGSMLTVHARSAADVFDRIVSLALLASSGASERALHRQARAAVGLVVHLHRPDGLRRVAEILHVE